jgi:hypothetical protein
MADVTVGNLRELLEARIGEGDAIRLVGDHWSLNHVLYDLYILPPQCRFPPSADILRRATMVWNAAPFNWLVAALGTVEEARPVLAEACHPVGHLKPLVDAVFASDLFTAVLGCLLGEDWSTPRIEEMRVTPDRCLLRGSSAMPPSRRSSGTRPT